MNQEPGGEVNILLILAVFFGIGFLVFAGLTIYAFSSAGHDRAILNDAKQQAYAQGQKDQSTTDAAQAKKDAENPYRSYTAPQIYGSFVVNFPKNWSAYVTYDSGNYPINLIAHPDLIRVHSSGDDPYALHVVLENRLYSDKVTDVKNIPGVKVTDNYVVDGIKGTRIDGKYDYKHNGSEVLLPLRDKTLELATDDSQFFGTEFNTILQQIKINP